MTKVYMWPADLGGSTLYTHPTRIRATRQWDGGPGQRVEQAQRSFVEFSGEVVRANAPDFDIMLDRLDGGLNLVGLWDMEQRAQNGWDIEPAVDASGDEFWRADGRTSTYAGESANAPTGPWRSIFAAAAGGNSLGSTSLAVDGLLANEVIPRGTWVRAGEYRYRTASAATANGSGAATLTLAKGLRATVANNDPIRIPGDFFVGSLIAAPEVSAAGVFGVRTFTLRFSEVYEAEVLALSSASPPVGFEW